MSSWVYSGMRALAGRFNHQSMIWRHPTRSADAQYSPALNLPMATVRHVKDNRGAVWYCLDRWLFERRPDYLRWFSILSFLSIILASTRTPLALKTLADMVKIGMLVDDLDIPYMIPVDRWHRFSDLGLPSFYDPFGIQCPLGCGLRDAY